MVLNNISQSTLWVVSGFLLITLALGLYAGRGIKDIKEYALGNERFSTITLVLTFLATYIGGGSIIGAPSEVYSFGIVFTVACLGIGIQHLIMGLVIAPRILNFKKCLTLGDLIGKMYGKKAKFLAGVLTFFNCVCSISLQLLMLGLVSEYLLNIKASWGIIIGGTILGIYSAIGGIKAVTVTDVLQFLILIITIPIIGSFLLKNVGGYKELFLNVPEEKFVIFGNKKFYYWLTYFMLWSIFFEVLTDPPSIQRVFMANSRTQVRNQFFVIAAFDPILRILVMIIGLSILLLFPNIESKNAILYAVKNLFSSGIVKGIIISGFLAVIMSTADSLMHSAGLLFANDIIRPLLKKTNNKLLLYARLATIFVALISVVVAINYTNSVYFRHLSLIRVMLSSPVLLFPLLSGILGIKTDKRSFIFGIISGVLFLIFSYLYLPLKMKALAIPIGIIANGLVYMISHVIQNKGIAWIKREENKEEQKHWIPNPQQIFSIIINAIPTPKKIFNYSRAQVMKNGSQNMLFGIYACINFTLPYFLWDHQDPDKYNLMTTMRLIGGIMAGLLIVKDQWKEFLKPFYPLYWHITLTYCLPFITTIMFLLTGGSTSWLLNVGTSIFFLIILVTGEVFLILAPLGIGLGLAFYKYYIGPINISSLGFDINYYLIYQLVFSTIIGLLFAYRKRVFNVMQGNIGLNLGSSLCHEIRNTLYSLTCSQFTRKRIEMIQEKATQNVNGEESYILPKQMLDSIYDQTNQAINFDEDTLKVIKTFETIFKDYKTSLSNPRVYSMKSVVEYTLKELHFLPGQKEKIKLNLVDDFYVKLPKSAFSFVISNIIRNAFKHGRATEVEIKLENHKLKIRDNGKGIPSSEQEKIFKMHYSKGNKESTGIGLGFAKLIVNSCYGEIWCESEEGVNSYSEFIIEFPEVSATKILKESIDEANEEGRREEKEKIAIKMLRSGKSIKEIESYTELNKTEIENLKRD